MVGGLMKRPNGIDEYAELAGDLDPGHDETDRCIVYASYAKELEARIEKALAQLESTFSGRFGTALPILRGEDS